MAFTAAFGDRATPGEPAAICRPLCSGANSSAVSVSRVSNARESPSGVVLPFGDAGIDWQTAGEKW